MYLFTNILGAFVFDEKFEVADKVIFKYISEYQNKEQLIERLKHKHGNLKAIDKDSLKKILQYFRNQDFFEDFYKKNIELARIDLKNSVTTDLLISHAINSYDELEKNINSLVKRLREWYELYNPEASRAIDSHENFVVKILESEKNEILDGMGIKHDDSFGADFAHEDIEPIKRLAQQIYGMFQLRKTLLDYASKLMDELCPNMKTVCGPLVAGRLLEHAGSLKRLSGMPASTIQILGAETALFRHLKTGAKPPRHGIIINHPLLSSAPDRMHGKIARTLADKISIAAKVDYFKGKFIGDELRKQLEDKLSKLK